MKLIKDNTGNVLIMEGCKQGFYLFLRLSNEQHRRMLGRVNTSTRRIHIERNPKEHLLNKANAYGFNEYILNKAQTFDTIIVYETPSGNVYELDRKEMLSSGEYLFFKQQGFEKQIFLSREWMGQYQIIQPEKIKQLIAEKRLGI